MVFTVFMNQSPNVRELSVESGLSADVCTFILDMYERNIEDFHLLVKSVGGSGEGAAIKNEDFPFLKEAAKSIASLVAGTAFAAWAPMAIASLVILLFDYRKKLVPLSAREVLLVREIKRQPGATAKSIASSLDIECDITPELDALKAKRRNDGKIVPIVSVDESNGWHIEDI
jgi:hypothetical protein